MTDNMKHQSKNTSGNPGMKKEKKLISRTKKKKKIKTAPPQREPEAIEGLVQTEK